MDEKEQLQKEINEKLDEKISISRRDVILVLVIFGLILVLTFMTAWTTRGSLDEEVLLNVLAWWKVQRDCSECDEPTCTAASYYLGQYNLSGMPIHDYQGENEHK